MTQEIAVDWATFEKINAELGTDTPDGLVVHAAGPSANGVRMITVWQSKEAFDRFGDEQLLPALQRVGVEPVGPLERHEIDVQLLRIG
ncbi:MAG TPA: hypothetical protein VFB78_07985 [Acidimicrobiales bacterium]|nr:hypothetical protein [Acidimicrobiales bacterium]